MTLAAASSYPLLNLFWTLLEIFALVLWFWLLFRVFGDLFAAATSVAGASSSGPSS